MGTRDIIMIAKSVAEDHPHAYGDKPSVVYVDTVPSGSSPRVWGQDNRVEISCKCDGIIPTRMGTRVQKSPKCPQTRDHPHAYGDKNVFQSCNQCFPGSSPRVWGQVCQYLGILQYFRIIPTRMGTSICGDILMDIDRDHPHAYGDKL